MQNFDAEIAYLRSTTAIRERCGKLFAWVKDGHSKFLNIDETKFPAVAQLVAEEIKINYGTAEIPFHSRWRHFVFGGRDLWEELCDRENFATPLDKLRTAFDLVIPSVLLDAGAGAMWVYQDKDLALVTGRSEGLALATFRMFESGLFSAHDWARHEVDALRLAQLTEDDLGKAFQMRSANPLTGLEGRLKLLHGLALVMRQRPEIFGPEGRLGMFADHLVSLAGDDGYVSAERILGAVLDVFSPLWPGRLTLHGENLGDVWQHEALREEKMAPGLVPFHKLSQWLTYSLLEPLMEYGLHIPDVDSLTGLPEYRNGGLFLDGGWIGVKDTVGKDATQVLRGSFSVEHPLIVEWRALTVCGLDRMLSEVRRLLNRPAAQLPLAALLQGGSWSAGRRIAQKLRPGGAPPVHIESDGTVF